MFHYIKCLFVGFEVVFTLIVYTNNYFCVTFSCVIIVLMLLIDTFQVNLRSLLFKGI